MASTETDALHHPAREAIELHDVLAALADPVRLAIVRELARDGERLCGSFTHLGVTKSTLSHHFRVLRESGVARKRPEGARAFLTLRRDDLDARFPGLLAAVLAQS